MLAAEIVGASGNIIGIGRSPQAIALAQKRVRDTPHRSITFAQCAVEDYADTALFDAVVGRYILIHQSDPAGFLRAAARLLQPGGILALHEIEFGRLGSFPSVEIWNKTARVIVEFFRRTLPRHDIATG
jgi:2-polyprenyl-3-methyl-5-hydroxy-6-metoxy-1,4-benzoquinol methylase